VILAASVSTLLLLGVAHASVVSRFDSNADGWDVVVLVAEPESNPNYGAFPTPLSVNYSSLNGNPDGHIWKYDPGPHAFYFDAPSKFLGNQLATYGGSLSFDLRDVPDDPNKAYTTAPDVVLVGAGLTIVLDDVIQPGTSWSSYAVSFVAGSSWHKGTLSGASPTASEFQSVLADLDALRILGDQRSDYDTGYLDNVVLSNASEVPEPSTLLLWSGLGAIGLIVASRRKRRAA